MGDEKPRKVDKKEIKVDLSPPKYTRKEWNEIYKMRLNSLERIYKEQMGK